MKTKKTVLFIYTETPLHAGTGTGLGAVDLPIQREKHTNYPIIQASGVKGALRDTAELSFGRGNQDTIKNIFGADSDGTDIIHASAISPSDARILLFPVRALNGVFLWITSRSVLNRFARDIEGVIDGVPELNEKDKKDDKTNEDENIALVSDNSQLVGGSIMLEEYAYPAKHDAQLEEWAKFIGKHALKTSADYWRTRLETHLVLLPDNDFRDFVTYSTEIVTRIHLDDTTKVVRQGQLFTQELLPADSLLYSNVIVTDTRGKDNRVAATDVLKEIKQAIGKNIQIGADETVGRGRVILDWTAPDSMEGE